MKLTLRKHKVKNLVHLQALVTENAEAIEPGFHVIGQSLNLGRSTVDLAGLDSRQTPVLIALGFVADDRMLFRMLEAYAWCLEYPESVRRLVPAEDGPAEWPPRVVFVGERVLESFQRKIGLLRFPAVDCFEFRCVEVNGVTGFYLDAVDWAKGSPAEPREPASTSRRATPPRWLELRTTPVTPAEPAGGTETDEPSKIEPADDPGAKDRGVLDGSTWLKFLEKLTGTFESRPETPAEDTPAAPAPAPAPLQGLAEQPAIPPQPEPPAPAPPQPARSSAVARPAVSASPGAEEPPDNKHPAILEGLKLPSNGELAPQWRKFLDRPSADEAKIGAVKEYLHREFPLCTVYDFHEFQRGAQVFQLQDNQGKVSQLATITDDFFEARRDSEIRPWLERHKLAHALRQAGQGGVLVTSAGLQIERR